MSNTYCNYWRYPVQYQHKVIYCSQLNNTNDFIGYNYFRGKGGGINAIFLYIYIFFISICFTNLFYEPKLQNWCWRYHNWRYYNLMIWRTTTLSSRPYHDGNLFSTIPRWRLLFNQTTMTTYFQSDHDIYIYILVFK